MKFGFIKWNLGMLAVFLIASPSISFFKYQRPVQSTQTGGQHYAVVDDTLWQHTRADLDDVRLYSGPNEIPFALTIERGSSGPEQKPLRILQPGTVGGKTQFLLDMAAAPEYDRVQLTLATENFVAHARVEGQDDPHGKQWATLGITTLYDLTEEKLGHNSTLQIPLSTYKYLRVTVDSSVKPSDVLQASAGETRAEKAVWRDVSRVTGGEQKGRETVFKFDVPNNVPAERISFTVEPAQRNFQRSVEVQDNKGRVLGTGEISRIHLLRNGQKIDVEETSLAVRFTGPGTVQVLVHNGDDLPLKFVDASLQQYERRIYFEGEVGGTILLYYGDEKLSAPVYDYRKLFQTDANADRLTLGAEILNAAYTGRPDERQWSERHPAVLWAAILAAVLLLGGLSYRSLKSATT
jgi:Protein of unknown function (DUF3999)